MKNQKATKTTKKQVGHSATFVDYFGIPLVETSFYRYNILY